MGSLFPGKQWHTCLASSNHATPFSDFPLAIGHSRCHRPAHAGPFARWRSDGGRPAFVPDDPAFDQIDDVLGDVRRVVRDAFQIAGHGQ